jgi:diguanylate cyclase (GGDEF)-like protein/PAS domain S-box-containing protein
MNPWPASVLVVDDEEMNRDLLGRRLELEGYVPTLAGDGREALALLDKQPFDLVLLDVMMPELSGLQVLSRVRQSRPPEELPVIMVTAKSQSEDLVEAFNLGANDYVTKPIDFPVAVARIKTQLSSKRAQAALRESEMRYALAARGANDGLWDWDLRSDEIYYSPRWKAMLGHTEAEIGTSPEEWFRRVHPEDLGPLQAALQEHRQGLSPQFQNEHRMMHKDKCYRWMLSRAVAVKDTQGNDLRMAGSQTDITRSKAADALTGLPNRASLMDHLERALERTRRHDEFLFALLFLDLDRFKVINDSLGHLAGDQLLIELARRLEGCLRYSDTIARLDQQHTVARFGGDEFSILLDGISHAEDARRVADRIHNAMKRPFFLAGQEVFTSASIGIAIGGPGYDRPEDLLRDADTAMYHAKTQGKARSLIFDTAMRTHAVARLQMETDLRHALERRQFRLHYQPIISLKTDRITRIEALLRWEHPERGLLLPREFVPLAEETGLIVTIGQWALREACRQMKAWQLQFRDDTPQIMCVNLSSKQFLQEALVVQVAAVLRETGLAPANLELEITESAIMDDPEGAATMLAQLRTLGVHVALDDFGTGYSSFSYLHRFPIETLKIDRSFVAQMDGDDEKSEIVRTIVALAHNLNMKVVAEGVERPEQQAQLLALECEYGQGFHFSNPVDSDAVAALFRTHPRGQADGR